MNNCIAVLSSSPVGLLQDSQEADLAVDLVHHGRVSLVLRVVLQIGLAARALCEVHVVFYLYQHQQISV
jgi:hypothetical protein